MYSWRDERLYDASLALHGERGGAGVKRVVDAYILLLRVFVVQVRVNVGK